MSRYCPLGVLLLLLAGPAGARPLVHHELQVTLTPDRQQLQVEDRLTLPPEFDPPCLTLAAGLQPWIVEPNIRLEAAGSGQGLERFCLQPQGVRRFTLRYGGPISRPTLPTMEGPLPPISPRGTYLDGAGAWYPRFDDEQVSFRLDLLLPHPWRGVTQGSREARTETPRGVREVWEERLPQEDIYLIAAPFHEYTGETEPAQALAFLRQEDPELAWRYLDATALYLDFYSRLLGPYPYDKFALVENVWESGYGMPSFTLLGPRVIRLPFILHTSFPHEILHNWWGNGVYPDYANGNWSEGLTAYLADHLLKERQGEGADHRRAALQRFTDFVSDARDFPLARFRSRHDPATQAVGYDKGLMFFHMLRLKLGDEVFLAGLRRFYREYRHQRAGFEQLRQSLEAASGEDLAEDFDQWLERPGAPQLQIRSVQAVEEDTGFRLTGTLEQVQPGPAYRLRVPLAVQLAGWPTAFETVVEMDGRELNLDLALPAAPQRLRVDPRFDLMRRLDRGEIPPSLGQAFGAEQRLLVLPAEAPEETLAAYERLARTWAGEPGWSMVRDDELEQLPEGRSIWLLGWENRFRPQMGERLQARGAELDEAGLTLLERRFDRAPFDGVVAVRHPGDRQQALIWLGAEPVHLPALARKLPHYGRYSYLVFTGPAADNVLKGQWPVIDSPLEASLREGAPPWQAELPPRQALGEALGN